MCSFKGPAWSFWTAALRVEELCKPHKHLPSVRGPRNINLFTYCKPVLLLHFLLLTYKYIIYAQSFETYSIRGTLLSCLDFTSINHFRLNAACSCSLALMLTGLILRGEMKEWWMVIVFLLLLNVWPRATLIVPCSALTGRLGLGDICVLPRWTCCNEKPSPGLGLCAWSQGISWPILVSLRSNFFCGALKQMGCGEVWVNTYVLSRGARCLFWSVCFHVMCKAWPFRRATLSLTITLGFWNG